MSVVRTPSHIKGGAGETFYCSIEVSNLEAKHVWFQFHPTLPNLETVSREVLKTMALAQFPGKGTKNDPILVGEPVNQDHLPWYEQIHPHPRVKPAWLNIGGYLVTANTVNIFDDPYNDSIKPYALRGSRLARSRNGCSLYDDWAADGFDRPTIGVKQLRNEQKRLYVERLTLVDPTTMKPDFEMTQRWHTEDPLFPAIQANNKPWVAAGYGIEEALFHPDDAPQGLGDVETHIASLNTLFQEAGYPQIKATQLIPVLLKSDWVNAEFNVDGVLERHLPEKHSHYWGWRVVLTLDDKFWLPKLHLYCSYNPKDYPNTPWRYLGSTQCQSQTQWQKAAHLQPQPEATWDFLYWVLTYAGPKSDRYPNGNKPLFIGSEFKKTRVNLVMQNAVANLRTELARIKIGNT